MSLPFSRSLRSLSTDRFLVARIGLILAGIAVVALLTWFFFAHVSLYEYSSDLKFTSEGLLAAQFSPETAARLRPGQEGSLKLAAAQPEDVSSSPVYVFRIDRETGVVDLVVLDLAVTDNLVEGKVDGLVEVEVTRITPVDLVLRTGIGGRSLSTSPAGDGQTQDK